MPEQQVVIRQIVTKDLHSLSELKTDQRLFEGILSAETLDKQNEIVIIDELEKVLPLWMSSNAPITDTHSNRVVGRGINYSRVMVKTDDGRDIPAIKIIGEIYDRGYRLDDAIWESIKNGTYKGLSFGGATRADREPVALSDGGIGYNLKDLEQYEVAVCREPANPLALITDFNRLAKAGMQEKGIGLGHGLVKAMTCDKLQCFVAKSVSVDLAKGTIKKEDIPELIKEVQSSLTKKIDEVVKPIENLIRTQVVASSDKMVAEDSKAVIRKEDDKKEDKKDDEDKKDMKEDKKDKSTETMPSWVQALIDSNKAVVARVEQIEKDLKVVKDQTPLGRGVAAEIQPAVGSDVKTPKKNPQYAPNNQNEADAAQEPKNELDLETKTKSAEQIERPATSSIERGMEGADGFETIFDEVRKSGSTERLKDLALKIKYDKDFVNKARAGGDFTPQFPHGQDGWR